MTTARSGWPFAPFLALTMVAVLFLVLYAVLATWE